MSTELTPEQEKQVQERLKEKEKQMWERHHEIMNTEMSWLLKAMKDHFGEEAYQVAVKARGETILKIMSKRAEEIGDNSIEAYIKDQWEPLPAHGFENTIEKPNLDSR